MKTQSKIMLTIASSVSVSVVIAFFVFSFLRDMNTELTRITAFREISNRTSALSILTAASFNAESDLSDIRQAKDINLTLGSFLDGISSLDLREEALIKQLQKSYKELEALIDQMFVSEQFISGNEIERREILSNQIRMKAQFISDDTYKLRDISHSRMLSAQEKTATMVMALIILLVLTNAGIYFFSTKGIARSEESLRESEERFRAMVDASSDVIYKMSPDWTMMLRLEGGAFIPDTLTNCDAWIMRYIPPDDHANVMKAIQEAVQRKKVFELEHRVMREDGIVGWTFSRAVPLLDANGEIREWFGAASDITKRKEAEEALRVSEQIMESFLEASPGILNIIDENFRFIKTAHLTPTYFGLERQSIVGNSLADLNPSFIEKYGPIFRNIIETGKPVLNMDHIRRFIGNNEITHWSESYFRVPLPNGKRGIGIIGVDITELIKTKEALNKANNELELRVQERTIELALSNKKLVQMNKELEEFAYVTAHDLQEPLRKIQTFGSRLQEAQNSLNGQSQEDLGRIVTSAARMASLLRGLKTYSALTSEEHSFIIADLSKVVEGVISDLELTIQEAEARIEVSKLPSLEIYELGMRQLFQNLISNSIKFRKENEKPVIKIAGWLDKGMVRIQIEDNGIGFEEQYLNQIFKPFKRLHANNSKYEGTGIGLAVCHKVIQMHGGTITAESTPGVGSKFIITLPLEKAGHKESAVESEFEVSKRELLREVYKLTGQLLESEEVISAIKEAKIDALVCCDPEGEKSTS